MEVKRITTTDTINIRHLMLRQGFPAESCQFDGDDDELTFHLGAFVEKKLVSVASFYYEKHGEIPGEHHFRLRGMATLPEFQKKGFSSALLRSAIPLIKQNHCPILWCNARLGAQGFYEHVGFKPIGSTFDIPTVGPHQLMYIDLETL